MLDKQLNYLKTHPYLIHAICYTIIGVALLLVVLNNNATASKAESAAQLALINSQENKNLLAEFKADTKERRDQSCELFEGDHLDEVKALRQTYNYLAKLTPETSTDPLNQLIISQLPKTEEEARTDEAPEYCDAPHVGLAEPDPNLPPKRYFSNLIVPTQ